MITQCSTKSFCRIWRKPIYRLAQWLTGNTFDAEDVVQDAALRAFCGIKSFGAVNARAWSLTIVRNTAYSWLMKNRPKVVVFTEDLSVTAQQDLASCTSIEATVEPTGLHDAGDPDSIVAVALVDLHLKHRLGMARIDTDHR